MLNARKVSRFKKGYDTLPKNDRIDAWVIADHLRFGRLPYEMQEDTTVWCAAPFNTNALSHNA